MPSHAGQLSGSPQKASLGNPRSRVPADSTRRCPWLPPPAGMGSVPPMLELRQSPTPHTALPAPQSPRGHLRATTRFPRRDLPTQLPPSPPAPCATAGERMWGAGSRMKDPGCGIQGVGCGVWDVGSGVWDVECGMWGAGARVWDTGCRVQNMGCGIQTVGSGVQDAGSRMQDLEHRIWDVGSRG